MHIGRNSCFAIIYQATHVNTHLLLIMKINDTAPSSENVQPSLTNIGFKGLKYRILTNLVLSIRKQCNLAEENKYHLYEFILLPLEMTDIPAS